MKKKTLLKALMAFVCILSAGFALVSCGSDDDPDTPSGNDKATHAQYTYKIMPTQAVLNIADISITYTDGNGKEQTEKVTSTSWSKTVTCKSLPAHFKRTVTLTPKSGVDAEAKYDVEVGYGYELKTLNSAGKTVQTKTYNKSTTSKGLKGSSLATVFSRIGALLSFGQFVSEGGDIGSDI